MMRMFIEADHDLMLSSWAWTKSSSDPVYTDLNEGATIFEKAKAAGIDTDLMKKRWKGPLSL